MDNPFKSPAVLSLCTGIRGLERGLERAIGEIRTVTYVEIEAVAAWNLVKQMEQGVLAPSPVFTDVKTFVQIAHHFCGKVHGITGGYPCQPFSLAGQRKGTEDPRHLWPHIARIIAAVRPVWCFFENVDDHLTLGYDEVQKSLWEMGYAVEADVFSSEEVGAPHERKRLFILAVAHSYLNGPGARSGGFIQESCDNEGAPQGKNWKRLRNDIGNSGETLADAKGKQCNWPLNTWSGGNGFTNERKVLVNPASSRCKNIRPFGKQEISCDPRAFFPSSKRPARPGEQQYEWEEPRTIPRKVRRKSGTKSGLGTTVNGYNFREDLLRMAGNSVDEETAELAFRTLIQKFY